MAIRDYFKVSRRTFFDPASWIDAEGLAERNQAVISSVKAAISKPVPGQKETFEEAVKRLGLTEDDIQASQKNYRLYAIMLAACGLLVLFYTAFIFFRYFTFLGLLLGLAATSLFFAKAFQNDFLSLQIKERKLGLTFNDWKERYFGN